MIKHLLVISAALGMTFSNQVIASPKSVSANEFIQLFEKLNGKHPGVRKAHASGVCAVGEFQPNTQSNLFKNAPLLSSGTLPVTLRFSMGGGNPMADERTTGTRGMGMQINLPGGARHIFTGNNFPVFAGKDPETFFGFLSTLLPDENGKRDTKKTQEYIKNNPSVQGNVAWNAQAKTPASYANTEFFGLHTFFYGNGAEQVKFRWQLTPDLGVKTLSKEQAQQLKPAFLADKLANQINQGTVSFTLKAGIFHHLITLPTYHTAALSTDNLAKEYFGDAGMLGYVAGVQRKEIRQGIACVKHQNMAGSDMGDDHKEYFSGDAALKAAGEDNTMNQFG